MTTIFVPIGKHMHPACFDFDGRFTVERICPEKLGEHFWSIINKKYVLPICELTSREARGHTVIMRVTPHSHEQYHVSQVSIKTQILELNRNLNFE